ncbi:MAG: sulfurtransferase, partial [Rhabdaerophilum sp.]
MFAHRRHVLASLVAAALLAPLTAAMAGTPLRGLIDGPSLSARLGEKTLVVVDIRSGETREKGRALFQSGHIPGAVHADYAHASWRLPRENTSLYLPEPAQFEALAGDLGIAPESDVVIVHEGTDSSSFGAAARVYWSFKAMGHASIAILDGGYKGWTDDKARPVATGDAMPVPAIYEARPDASLRARLGDVLKARESGTLLVDSRPEAFFSGKEKHKAIPVAGHIPGAVNIPHARAFTADNRLKDKVSLAREFSAAANSSGAIAYCNTGHWAATDWFVMSEVLGLPGVKLY